jgi:hypothetical protein
MWESASPNPVSFTNLISVSKALSFHRADSAKSFRSVDRVLFSVLVWEVLREEHLGALHTGCLSHTVKSVSQVLVWVLSAVSHRISLT